MRPPETLWSLCAHLFGLMGALFLLLGLVFSLAGIPVRNGPSWSFLPIGGALLLAGLAAGAGAWGKARQARRLKAEGIKVTGTVQSVQHLVWINWNTSSFVNWPGKCSPWVIRCSYSYQGQTYSAKSGLAWSRPASGAQRPVLYLDPRRPSRAWVDLDTIRWEL